MTDIQQLAKNLRGKVDFQEFQEYVLDKVRELDTVSDLGTMSNEKAGEEAKVRLLAGTKLRKILTPFIDFAEKHEYTDEEIAEAAAKRGL